MALTDIIRSPDFYLLDLVIYNVNNIHPYKRYRLTSDKAQ